MECKKNVFGKALFFSLIMLLSGVAIIPIEAGSNPIVQLIYPKGGERVSGIVTIEWYAIASNIYLYYKTGDGDDWNQINDVLPNTGEYEWDTTTVVDEYYKIHIVATGDGMACDTSGFFLIDNYPKPPYKPTINGPTRVKPLTEYNYTSSAVDPEGDQVYYLFKWGPFTNSGWLGPYGSGEICEANNSWIIPGTYGVQVKAKDEGGLESEWSEPLSVAVPKNKLSSNLSFLQLLEKITQRFPILEQIFSHNIFQ